MKPIWPWLFLLIVVGVWILCWCAGAKSFVHEFWTSGDSVDKIFGIFIAVMTTFLAGLVCAGAAGLGCGLESMIGAAHEQVWHQCWSSPLVSIRNADGETGSIRGGIFMVAGNIGQTSTYFYYIPTSDGGLRQNQWKPDDDTTIYEEDRKDGQVVQFDKRFKEDWVNWIGSPGTRLRMDFHIPNGSLDRRFSLK